MSRIGEMYERMRGEWTSLQKHWEATREQWHDTVEQRFEKEFWREWEQQVPKALKRLAELERVLDQALADTK